MKYVESYSQYFQSYRHDVSEGARQYCQGLMMPGYLKNMERMAEVVPESNSRNLQQFLTHSQWDATAVMGQVAREADEFLGGKANTMLLVDESGFKKQGKHSAGVARQYCGRLGKVDNCQVGVFTALTCGQEGLLVGARLYLPEEWSKDSPRCEKAGIPEDQRIFKTKPEIALEMVADAKERGLRFSCVGADGGYGGDLKFMRGVEDLGIHFMVDVHSDQRVYLKDPRPEIPVAPEGRGRRPKRLGSCQKPMTVKQLLDAQPSSAWKTIRVRDTSRGKLVLKVFKKQVYLWDGHSTRVDCWTVVASRPVEGEDDLKMSLTNYASTTPRSKLVALQRQRYWIERTFQDGKGNCGMADYQARKWKAWHHHMALVMMSLRFLYGEQVQNEDDCPLLSCGDIQQLLAEYLPRKDRSVEAVVQSIRQRHRLRQRAIDSHRRCQQRRLDEQKKNEPEKAPA